VSPGAIVALVKDIVIVAAIAFVFYFVRNSGEDLVKLKDVQGLKLQLQDNASREQRWREEQINADSERDASVKQLAASIAGQRAPVYVLRGGPADPRPLPGDPAAPRGAPALACGIDRGPRADRAAVDIRPQINQFELKYETAFADCRALLSKWPVAK